jgi:hypothetical protein
MAVQAKRKLKRKPVLQAAEEKRRQREQMEAAAKANADELLAIDALLDEEGATGLDRLDRIRLTFSALKGAQALLRSEQVIFTQQASDLRADVSRLMRRVAELTDDRDKLAHDYSVALRQHEAEVLQLRAERDDARDALVPDMGDGTPADIILRLVGVIDDAIAALAKLAPVMAVSVPMAAWNWATGRRDAA